MIAELLKRLKSLEEEVLSLREEVEENRRAAANIIRLAVVDKADKTAVDVITGKNKATRIPFFVHCAGRVSHYRRPSKGEQCLLINLGSGDNLNNAVALMGLPSTQYPCPTIEANEVMTDYGNGMSELYNLDDASLTAHYPGGVKVYGDIWQDGSYKATGDITDHTRSMQADRDIYNEHHHKSPETKAPTSPPEQTQ